MPLPGPKDVRNGEYVSEKEGGREVGGVQGRWGRRESREEKVEGSEEMMEGGKEESPKGVVTSRVERREEDKEGEREGGKMKGVPNVSTVLEGMSL